uniref:Transmembrane protein n=1 Tax=Aplanochytrium stocchinoi TaxID=215587 RepID=A0A7S3LQG5_9STRA|mmetsp:Transcript_18244/g.22498  ORF Transcript_18244/g.22498 Transcript_18244/m.22498 type:complete len:197 (+) Transcript_18244:215-805(+)|eukprot:CAMPEP_0204834316 /NCGR_PEP_ID=MMETSP1346-20131115/19518_1 /ASSEMBLY_ACC=CAM_ASM_000771 /TAXON_ID=215587 /ORGANISM="Aplanochytrium stocchinoi, Strain GSBS06" /LENGTH=196 /DNA_ID=CAMNT_0051967561 /DNA_START=199 /DNA_END=789 /DNA_ORIENTATION=-
MLSLNLNEDCLQYLVGGKQGEVLEVEDCVVTVTLSSNRNLMFGFLVFITLFSLLLSAFKVFHIWNRSKNWRCVLLGYQAQAWIIVGWACTFILIHLLGVKSSDEESAFRGITKSLLIASVALFGLTLHYCVRSTSDEDEEKEEEEEDDDIEGGDDALDSDVTDEECDTFCPVSFPPKYKYNEENLQPQGILETPLL